MRLLSQFVEELDISDLYSMYQRIPENLSPRTILKVVLYAYMNGDFSSRDIEEDCRRDINFMFLLEDTPVPDHAAFACFHTLHFTLCSKKILAAVQSSFTVSVREINSSCDSPISIFSILTDMGYLFSETPAKSPKKQRFFLLHLP